ncbi:hypothetical protein PISMIDRAFT_120191, partial [Pisolithus microcarpus 441]
TLDGQWLLFPAIGTNGVLQPGEPLSHDMVQKWIDEAVAGSGIPGTFSTHCYCRGGVEYKLPLLILYLSAKVCHLHK